MGIFEELSFVAISDSSKWYPPTKQINQIISLVVHVEYLFSILYRIDEVIILDTLLKFWTKSLFLCQELSKFDTFIGIDKVVTLNVFFRLWKILCGVGLPNACDSRGLEEGAVCHDPVEVEGDSSTEQAVGGERVQGCQHRHILGQAYHQNCK